MPWIHTYQIPIFQQPLPMEIPQPFEVYKRPGMAGASVLFHAAAYDPFTLVTITSAADKSASYLVASRFAALRKSRVVVDDGLVMAAGTVVLSCGSTVRDAGLVIGGAAVGDRWEVETRWLLLFDPDAMRGGA